MKNEQERESKRPYEKPAITYSRKVEALGATCTSVLLGTGATCRTTGLGCTIVYG
jgi:hypothetical protein